MNNTIWIQCKIWEGARVRDVGRRKKGRKQEPVEESTELRGKFVFEFLQGGNRSRRRNLQSSGQCIWFFPRNTVEEFTRAQGGCVWYLKRETRKAFCLLAWNEQGSGLMLVNLVWLLSFCYLLLPFNAGCWVTSLSPFSFFFPIIYLVAKWRLMNLQKIYSDKPKA